MSFLILFHFTPSHIKWGPIIDDIDLVIVQMISSKTTINQSLVFCVFIAWGRLFVVGKGCVVHSDIMTDNNMNMSSERGWKHCLLIVVVRRIMEISKLIWFIIQNIPEGEDFQFTLS